MRKWAARLLIGLAAPLAIYGVAVLALGWVPVNPDFAPPAQGIEIAIIDNGIHTDFVLPTYAATTGQTFDWRQILPPGLFTTGRPAPNSYLMFGWGHRDFYLNTPQWSDLTAITVFRAFFGIGGTVLHVSNVRTRWDAANITWFKITPRSYAALVGHITASMNRSASGTPVLIEGRSYGPNDGFIEARGRYGPVHTCNEWTRRGLVKAGIRTGLWTPFPGAIMAQFERFKR